MLTIATNRKQKLLQIINSLKLQCFLSTMIHNQQCRLIAAVNMSHKYIYIYTKLQYSYHTVKEITNTALKYTVKIIRQRVALMSIVIYLIISNKK